MPGEKNLAPWKFTVKCFTLWKQTFWKNFPKRGNRGYQWAIKGYLDFRNCNPPFPGMGEFWFRIFRGVLLNPFTKGGVHLSRTGRFKGGPPRRGFPFGQREFVWTPKGVIPSGRNPTKFGGGKRSALSLRERITPRNGRIRGWHPSQKKFLEKPAKWGLFNNKG